MMTHNRALKVASMTFACVLMLIAAQPAFGAVLAYEPVDGYTPGSIIGQAQTGTGFNTGTNWTRQGGTGAGWFANAVSGGLTYSKDGADLQVSGSQHIAMMGIYNDLRGRLDVSAAGPFSAYLNATPDRIANGTVYFSFLGNSPVGASGWGPSGGVSYNGAVNHPASNNIGIPKDGVTHLFVGKIEFNAGGQGEDLLSAWRDPKPGTAEGTTGTVLMTQTNLTSDADWKDGFNHFSGRGSAEWSFDEIRFGETFGDVTPAVLVDGDNPIPEPCTILLASLGLMGLGRYARRRRRI